MPMIRFPNDAAPAASGSALPVPNPKELRQRTARREITERRRITQRLRQALCTGGFVLHYQPIISLKSGLACGAETLIRLQHARRGLVPASHFMPAAERSDLIIDLAGWIINTACAEAASWPGHFSVCTALAPRHLQSGRLVRQLLEALSRSGLAPGRLQMAITELMLLDDDDDTMFALRALQGLGVPFALNNFGTGYASLSALKRLNFATLRLDRSLVQNMAEPSGVAIMRAAVEAGHALGCKVLAEGVEQEEQFLRLRDLGADEAQGPYFSPPVDAAEMAEMFAQN
ncbi:EAL domain-containing protein [Acidocella sp.]|uniref:EAL domain-containing protein n=1 Tax=Acidocella sp. TaxID=50710 RepID=UPI002618F846|nr:EAL domain-containing protein [Acidocella sp.]